MSEERRANANPRDVSGFIAILYTVGFMALATLLYFFPLPETNKDALLYLFGILSGIELQIIAFFFGGSKTVEATQRATEQRAARTDTVVQDIARAIPGVVSAPAVTPAPPNPVTGNTPAAEVAPPTEKDKP